ncbi:MAG: glycosyltransferase family 39 protein [Candidatus Gottesmanbacteria bacterium]|nr:glycosyltransferase family 39 protein [Candidatus Gottesmanbacteria bacterium]
MSIKIRIILIFIVGLAFGLRFYNVWDNPPALSWDEVSIGYNAYSILKTGRDEHGRFLPIDTFVGYGDYKPPLAIYLTVPFVALFGLNELAVRLPSVIFGTLTVLLTYFLVKELFREKEISPLVIGHWSFDVASIAAAILALSPWHINLSRAGFEATIALFFIVLGTVLCLAARRQERLYWVCWLPFVAAVYTFNSARYFVPFAALGVVVFIGKQVVVHKKIFLGGIILSIVLLLPILPHLFSKEARLRYNEVNIFSDSSIVERANDRRAFDNHSFISAIFDNRRIGYARSFLSHYFDHFTADFLFIKGDGNPKFSTQDVGQLYGVDLPFLLLGVYTMFAYFRPQAWFLIYWLITAIIPAAVARETPHALRILNSLPTWHIFIAFGIVVFLSNVHKKKVYLLCSILLVVLYVGNVSYYLHNYYIHYPRIYSGEWQYGYKQALQYVNANTNKYKKIYLSESIGRAYMYALFYTAYNPEEFQKRNSSYFDAAGFYHVDGFGPFIFGSALPVLDDGSLYIFPPNQVPTGVKIIKTIALLDGSPVLTLFEK